MPKQQTRKKVRPEAAGKTVHVRVQVSPEDYATIRAAVGLAPDPTSVQAWASAAVVEAARASVAARLRPAR